ncbi:MAG TPA: hypothetical protein PLM08_15450, partial [Polyangiaceae bacterium]|nr:hypothetical protein [Polyangiaceae bacterium]
MNLHPAHPRPKTESGSELLDFDQLSWPFSSACKPRHAFRIGIEAERFGVYSRTLQPLQYDGQDGILGLFHELVSRYGWLAKSESPGGPVVSL